MAALKRWWCNRYRLPPSHDAFVGQSVAELMMEFYEDLYGRRDELLSGANSHGASKDQMEMLASINEVLGEGVYVADPLIDQWERDLAEGRVPDLNAEG